jgi:protein gp37
VHCYAEATAKRTGLATWGSNGTRTLTNAKYWAGPIKWNREAEKAGERRRVFCASMADVFEAWDGPILSGGRDPVYLGKDFRASSGPADRLTLSDCRRRLFDLIEATPWLDWLLLTKRPENVRLFWPHWVTVSSTDKRAIGERRPRKYENVWIGTSVSDQATADQWIPPLLSCRDLAAVLFISAEPLVGPVQLDVLGTGDFDSTDCLAGERSYAGRGGRPGHNTSCNSVDWVIVGGESGPGARVCNVAWIRSIVEQCDATDVPCFVKQLGAVPVFDDYDASREWPDGVYFESPEDNEPDGPNVAVMKDAKGGDPREWPEDLRVREFPQPGSLVAK